MSIIIRAITLADTNGFHAALDSVAQEQIYLRTLKAPPVEGLRDFVGANLTLDNPQLVALDNGLVVGWCDICRSTDKGSEHCGGLGMGLIASHRGRGIGSALLKATLEAASSRFRRVELDVYGSNLNAIALYEKAGFVHEGRRREAIFRNDRYDDILQMALLFNLTQLPPEPS